MNLATLKNSASLHYLASQVLQRATPIAVMVVFGAVKGPAAAGLYPLMYGAVSALAVITSLNFGAYIQRISPLSDAERQDTARLAAAATLSSSLAGAVLLLVCLSPPVKAWLEGALGENLALADLLLCALSVPLLTLNLVIQSCLRGRQASTEFLLVSSCQGIAPLALLGAALALDWPVARATAILVFAGGLCGCIPTRTWLKSLALHDWKRWDFGITKEVAAYSLPLVPSVLLTRVNSQIDKWLLLPMGLAAVGIYSILYLAAQTIAMYQQSVTDSWFRAWMKINPSERAHLALRLGDRTVAWAGVAFGSLVLAGLIVVGPRVGVPWRLDTAFAAAALLAAFLLNGQSMVLSLEASRRMQTTAILVSGASFIGANVVLLLLLIGPLGLFGASLAFLAATGVRAASAGLRLFSPGEMAGLLAEAAAWAVAAGAVWAGLASLPLALHGWLGQGLAAAALAGIAAAAIKFMTQTSKALRSAIAELTPADACDPPAQTPAMNEA